MSPVPDPAFRQCGRVGADDKVCQIIGEHRQHIFTGEPPKVTGSLTLAGTATISAQQPIHPDFAEWTRDWLEKNMPAIEAKTKAYGSNSLAEEGRLFARAGGRDNIPQAEAIEIGCFVYAYGKIQRVADAMLRGELPGTDSWHDPAVYSLMAMFTRSKGQWP